MSTAAIIASRHAHNAKRPVPAAKTKVTAERLKAKQEALKERAKMQELFLKYDKSGTGKLDENEIKTMLTDLDTSTPVGTLPSDEELKFILKVADWDESGMIEKSEVQYVVSAWNVLTAKRTHMLDAMREFDVSGTGNLNKDELAAYLRKLNGGTDVSPEEVNWVWAQADVFGDGAIHGPEIVMASAAWFAYVDDDGMISHGASNAERGGILVAEEQKIRQTFRKWDCSGTGFISVQDLSTILSKTGVTQKQIEVLFADMDANRDGQVAYEEFINYIFSDSNSKSSVPAV